MMVKIAIKNPAPVGPNLNKWGDYHFGISLEKALTARGATVTQHFWPEWDREEGEDIIIVLRGKRSYTPPPEKMSLMWIISHPATVLMDEMLTYDRVFVASESHYDMVRNTNKIDVDIARQCTDVSLFYNDFSVEDRRGISFVANSRGVRREILSWAVQAGIPVSVVGRHWKSIGLQKLVKSDYISNSNLASFYRSTRLTLNDHWGDMSHYGYINNRIFDCIACGTPVISDSFPELASVCGNRLLYAYDSKSFWNSCQLFYLRYPDVVENVQRLWNNIGERYTFDARAVQILDWCTSQRWSRYKRHEGLSNPNDSALRLTVLNVIAVLRKRGILRELQTLHLFPSRINTATLFHMPDLSYLSGGIDKGPWHIILDNELSALADDHFDLILIENIESMSAQLEGGVDEFIGSALKKIAKNGMIVAPQAITKFLAATNWEIEDLSDGYVSLEPNRRALVLPDCATQ